VNLPGSLRRTATIAIAAFCLSGCLYSALGAEHNLTAVARLHVGMPLAQCLAELASGGSISIEREVPLVEVGRREQLPEPVAATLEHAEATTGRRVACAVVVDRQWGFAGFGVVHLFLDDRRELVGHHLQHIN
jgi:hypothetical protein